VENRLFVLFSSGQRKNIVSLLILNKKNKKKATPQHLYKIKRKQEASLNKKKKSTFKPMMGTLHNPLFKDRNTQRIWI